MSQAAGVTTSWDLLDPSRPSETGPSAVDVLRTGGRPRWHQWESTRAEWRRDREIKAVLAMHRQGLISRRRARLLLWRQGVDVGGWVSFAARLRSLARRLRRRDADVVD